MLKWLIEASQGLGKVVTPFNLFWVSFIEAIFFPIPPDVVLIPLAIMRPAEGLLFAGMAATGSVLGAAVSYGVGLKGGRPLLARLASKQRIERIQSLLNQYDFWATAVAGFTPIPYKVFAISAGVFSLNFKRFLIVSFISRGLRFGLIAVLLARFGPEMQVFIEAHFEWLTVGVVGAAATVYMVYRVFRWRRSRS